MGTATAILLMATATAILLIATAILLMAMDIVALTMAAIIRAIGTPATPTVGPTMDMAAILIVDHSTSGRPLSSGLSFLNASQLTLTNHRALKSVIACSRVGEYPRL